MSEQRELEELGIPPFSEEREADLVKHDADDLRNLYALTGPARREYIEQLAQADAARIRAVAEAQAEGILAVRRAEAEGYRLLGAAISECAHPELVVRLATLHAAMRVSKHLGDGQATKMFLPADLSELFSLVSALQSKGGNAAGASGAVAP